MSAFVCDFATFDYLATAARQWRLQVHNLYHPDLPSGDLHAVTQADRLAEILYAENLRSVLYRYPDDTKESAPGNVAELAITYRFRPVMTVIKPVIVLKALHCVRYQSCECPDYETTVAWKILEALESEAIRHLPGYDDAPWGLGDEDIGR